jgi:hypothetical protein
MQGLSERQYAAHVGLSRGAIQKARLSGRLVLHADGSIDAVASDARRTGMTDPAQQRRPESGFSMRAVPDAAVSAVGEALREHGLPPPSTGGATTFVQARTANEVLKAQERRLRLQQLKGELIDKARAKAFVFRLAREERDAWVNWPARVAALMAAEIGVDIAVLQRVLEGHVRTHLDDLARVRIDL